MFTVRKGHTCSQAPTINRKAVKMTKLGDSDVRHPATHWTRSAETKAFLRPNLSLMKPKTMAPTMTPTLKSWLERLGR